MRIIYSTLLLAFGNSLLAQSNDSIELKKLTDEILVNSKAYSNLRFICKKIGPRLSGSANSLIAVNATAEMLKEAGADTVFLQPCKVTHWLRGEKEQGYIQLADGKKYPLHLCALGKSVGTGPAGITAAVIEVKSFEELDRLGEAVIKGKIVFFNIPMNPAYIRTFSAYAESGKSRVHGPSRAARYGAIGVIVRSLASNLDDHPHTGVTVYNDSFPKIPAVAISTNDAEWLSSRLKKKIQLRAFIRTTSQNLPDAASYNVVSEIRGTEFPDEIITVGGHLDSWDLAEGAQDDGAGVVQSIEIIRAFKAIGLKPKRTIRAVLFMDEESGGKGSDQYFEIAKQKKEKHLFALESDGGGFTPRGFSLDMSEEQKAKVLSWKKLFENYDIYDFTYPGGGADIEPLKNLGAALAGLLPDSQRYFDVHHAETDVFECVSKRELDLGAAGMAMFVWLVSQHGL